MADKELSNIETALPSSDIESSEWYTNHSSLRECCNEQCRLSGQVRRVKSKGIILIIFWTYLQATVYYLLLHFAPQHMSRLLCGLLHAGIGLMLPITGYLADAHVGRYKLISCSLWITWISSILMTGILTLLEFTNFQHGNILIIASTIPLGISWTGFQANIVQFGIDQLIDASVMEYKSYIAWLVFSYMAGQMVVYYMIQCIEHKLFPPLLLSCNLTLALILNFFCGHVLIKEPTTHNPFKLVYKVVRYAIKHKHPRQRSAFTYCEDEIPSRIDFGKSKYGGPFTTEQVEDVKTLLRMIVLILIATAVYGLGEESHFNNLKITSIFIIHPLHQLRSKCSSEFIIIGFYVISAAILIPLHELLLHPLFGRILPTIKSLHKLAIGVILRISSPLLLLILISYSRSAYLQNEDPFSNATLLCVFQEPPGFFGAYIDYRWTAIPEFLYAVSDLMIYIGTLEFFCAQVPYAMKGLVIGFTYFSVIISVVVSRGIEQIFESRFLKWSHGIISCGFWYFVTKIPLQVIASILFFLMIKCYKRRKREDVLPNNHIFAERYYSTN